MVRIKGAKADALSITSMYPNPAKGHVNMVIESPVAERITLVVTDLSGEVVMQQAAQVNTGENQLRLGVSGLAAGSYFIKTICANGCEAQVQKFVKE